MAQWQENEYGDGEHLKLAKGKVRLAAVAPMNGTYRGTLTIHIQTETFADKEEAKREIIRLANSILTQASGELTAMETGE